MSLGLLVVMTAVVASPPETAARSDRLFDWTGIDYVFAPADPAIDFGLLPGQPAQADPPGAPAVDPFGTMGSKRWGIQGGLAVDVDGAENYIGQFGAGFTYFIVDDLSIEFELNLLYFSQEANDAVGGNFNMLFRWHFLTGDDWTVFTPNHRSWRSARGETPILFAIRLIPNACFRTFWVAACGTTT